MLGAGIKTLLLIISITWLSACGGLSQAPVGLQSAQGGPAEDSSERGAASISSHPEWAATTPGSVVCPSPEVNAKVRREDGGGIRPAELCVAVKRQDATGSYHELPDSTWFLTLEYRDPVTGEFRELQPCGGVLPSRPSLILDQGLISQKIAAQFAPPKESAAREIDLIVRILRIQPVTESCEDHAPLGVEFLLAITYPSLNGSWSGAETFTLSEDGVTFNPFLLSLPE